MYSQMGIGYNPQEQNVNRIIEQTAAVVSDVDQRLTALKLGLVQAAPHLAPVLLWKEIALNNPQVRAVLQQTQQGQFSPFSQGIGQTPFGTPQPQQGQMPTGIFGSAFGAQIPQSLYGLGATQRYW